MRIIARLCALSLLLNGSAALAVSPWIVFSDADSARIDRQDDRVLDNVAESFRAVGIRGFVLYGHTDRTGPAFYNRRLAQRRAEAVRAALLRRGVPAPEIEIIAEGEDRPLVETDDEVAERQNRRVEIVITCIVDPQPGFEGMRCGQ